MKLVLTGDVYHVENVSPGDKSVVPKAWNEGISVDGKRPTKVREAILRTRAEDAPRDPVTNHSDATMLSLQATEHPQNRILSILLRANDALRSAILKLFELFRNMWYSIRYPGYIANRRHVRETAIVQQSSISDILKYPGTVITSTGRTLQPTKDDAGIKNLYVTWVNGHYYSSDEPFPKIRTKLAFPGGRAECIFHESVTLCGTVLRDTNGRDMRFLTVQGSHATEYQRVRNFTELPHWEKFFISEARSTDEDYLAEPVPGIQVYRIGRTFYANERPEEVAQYLEIFKTKTGVTYKLVTPTQDEQAEMVILSEIDDAHFINKYAYVPTKFRSSVFLD